MEVGHGELDDVRNWKYDKYFLAMGNIILRLLLGLRKNDENDSVF